ncbi:hypothetical protein [Mycolicibacterium obuense]|uniref:hypothetical protein n=1 Tax=Mycolicibacterium obuense TaxID=1807 RepID=UPI0006539193|nr:hypothetical protein [Mycolicibacterium obuense]
MLVDPDVLRAFAGQVEEASSAIKTVDVGHTAATAADGLPGSTTQWAVRLVGGRGELTDGRAAERLVASH